MTTEEQIKVCAQQEETYRFERFTNGTAWEIGTYLAEKTRRENLAISVGIQVNGNRSFHFTNDGSTKFHEMWIDRKFNTMNESNKSTLHLRLMMDLTGEKAATNRWNLDPEIFAFLGGGFPIILKGGRLIGGIAVSGLSEQTDHDLIIEAIAACSDVVK